MSEAIVNIHDPEQLVLRYVENPRPDLKDMIMVQFAGLVERVARRFSGLESQEDLVQVGFIGLLNALSKYDPRTGVRFTTYATHLVAGEIKHYLRDRTQTIRQPAWLQELRHKVNKASTSLQASLGRTPLPEEIAEEIGVSATAVREVFQTQEMLKTTSLDATVNGEEDGSSEIDHLDAGAYSPEQLSVEDRVVLEEAMQQLRDLEREVLIHFHFDAMNQTEIAHKLGISCNYVSHILRQSLAKLRRILANEDEQDRQLKTQITTNFDETEVMDPVTGVFNEGYFLARLSEEIHRASSQDEAVSVLLIEFSGLSKLQGFYGDASVKDFLADAAEFLKESMRRLDVVCRYGENGFGVILPSTGPSVTAAQHRLMRKFEPWLDSRRSPGGPIKVHVGRSAFPEDGRLMSEMLESANPRLHTHLTLVDQTVTEERKAA